MSANGNGQLSPERLAALSAGLLLIDDARLYGVIRGGPWIDRAECTALLNRLRRQGIIPTPDEAEAAALHLMAELGVIRR